MRRGRWHLPVATSDSGKLIGAAPRRPRLDLARKLPLQEGPASCCSICIRRRRCRKGSSTRRTSRRPRCIDAHGRRAQRPFSAGDTVSFAVAGLPATMEAAPGVSVALLHDRVGMSCCGFRADLALTMAYATIYKVNPLKVGLLNNRSERSR